MASASVRPSLSGNTPLKRQDPEVYELIQEEKHRQVHGIELIASENFTSGAVLECLGSCMTNKYSEGQPGARYYGGNEVIDKMEFLCQARALKAFGLKDTEWGVNVQPYSGSPANFAVYTALLPPHSRVMGLDLPSGGHLTHGYYTAKKKISATSIFYESFPYKVDHETGLIDFDALRESALVYRPQMIICGASAYPRIIDFSKFREIANEVGAYLLADIAHISGLVATGQHPSPFEHCDVVTTTTHKSLRGPRSGMIFYKFRKDFNIKEAIDFAVFPSLQGGPHNHQITALAVQLKEVQTPEFKQYMIDVVKNTRALAKELMAKGHKMATDGSDNHLVLWDVRPHDLSGSKVERACELIAISVNKNAVHGDKSALTPGGVRIGTPAMTTRGCKEADFVKIAEFLDRAVKLCIEIQKVTGKKLKDFEPALVKHPEIAKLKHEVEDWAGQFGYPEIGAAPPSVPRTVLLATEKPFTADAVQGIQKVMDSEGYTLKKLEKYTEKAQLLEAMKGVDAMIIRSDLVHDDVMEAGKDSLKLVVRAGAGVDNIDLKAAGARGLTCMNTPGANANAVAELAFGMMIQNARNHWDGSSGFELKGKSLALYGYGAVARCLHTIAKAFEMTVSAFDPFLTKEQIEAGGATHVEKVEDLFQSQFVSLHVPSTPQTNGSINFALMSKMPKSCSLINTSRPEVVDEAGLKEMLEKREDFSYLSDVPPKTLAELQKVKNGERRVFVTKKKMGAQTAEANSNAGIQAANQIVGFFQYGETRGVVKA